jgi:deoxycytidine triphosphate deaminase
MQLTGKQIVEKNIITNFCNEGIQQQGVDVRIKKVSVVGKSHHYSSYGYIPKEGKTVTPTTTEIPPICLEGGKEYWDLTEGYYEVEFEEGCNIPNYIAMNFKTRSSLVRCGAEILSGQFDAGFSTNNMGAFLKVNIPITIEKGARVAQTILTETYEVDDNNLYNGQWQGDKQRAV